MRGCDPHASLTAGGAFPPPPVPPPSPPPPPRSDRFADYNQFSFTSSSFTALFPSLLSMFVLITTGENYVDLVSRPWFCYDPYEDHGVATQVPRRPRSPPCLPLSHARSHPLPPSLSPSLSPSSLPARPALASYARFSARRR